MMEHKPETVEQLLAEVGALTAEVRRMRHRIECLRGGLKSAAGWLLDADDIVGHEKCLEMAGDMEPPLNAEDESTKSIYISAAERDKIQGGINATFRNFIDSEAK